MSKKCEAMAEELGGAKTLWWEGTKTFGSAAGEEIYWLEVEQDWMIFTIDTIELDGCCNKKYQF